MSRKKQAPRQAQVFHPGRGTEIRIALGLAALCLLIFGQTFRHLFLNLGDDVRIYENPYVFGGLRWTGIVWAFGATTPFWQPAAWLSHMLDMELFGIHPGGHHIMSVLLHAASTVFLFLALARMTGARWRSATAAALFAIHPLHVGPVAWLAERGVILAGMFSNLALLYYSSYARQEFTWRGYSKLAACFVLGLLSHPVAAALPLVLILLDRWPLGRRAAAEKLPLLILSAAALWFAAVQAGGGSKDYFAYSLVTSVLYAGKVFWPDSLAAVYSAAFQTAAVEWIAALATLIGATVVAWWLRARAPYLLLGWLWYVAAVAPAVLLTGRQAAPRADGNVYFAVAGLFLVVVWGVYDGWLAWKKQPEMPLAVATVPLAFLALWSAVLTRHWEDSVAVFQRAVDVTGPNSAARHQLGKAYQDAGRDGDALKQYEEAARIDPANGAAYLNLSAILFKQKRPKEALAKLDRALQVVPGYGKALYNKAVIYESIEDGDSAMKAYEEALKAGLDFDFEAKARNALGTLYSQRRRHQDALVQFQAALRIDPGHIQTRKNLAITYYYLGRAQDAAGELTTLKRLAPNDTTIDEMLKQMGAVQ